MDFKKQYWGARLAQGEEHATPDLGVMTLSPMLGVETRLLKLKLKNKAILTEESVLAYFSLTLKITYQFCIFTSDVPIKHLEFPSLFSF